MSRFLLPCLACFLAACGQKGPLYLPPPVPAASTASTVQPAPAGSDEQGKQAEKDKQDTPAATPQP
ncbi:MAG: LPS translocon maturation chaperone LptM [Gammaproteobacteria bacterium]